MMSGQCTTTGKLFSILNPGIVLFLMKQALTYAIYKLTQYVKLRNCFGAKYM